jgi:hypothetical protein
VFNQESILFSDKRSYDGTVRCEEFIDPGFTRNKDSNGEHDPELLDRVDPTRPSKKLNRNWRNRFLSQEITFEVFRDQFFAEIWHNRQYGNVITAAKLWSEIQTEIKGSVNSHWYPMSYVPWNVYKTSALKKGLSLQTADDIFRLFGRYERWKSGHRYDLMDLVHFIIKQIKVIGYRGPRIHFLMVDEIQD